MEVLEARIVFDGHRPSSSTKTLRFRSRISGTASITRSTSANQLRSYSTPPLSRDWASKATDCSSLPFLTIFSKIARECAMALSTKSESTSLMKHSIPAAASRWAIPPPMAPPPITAAFFTIAFPSAKTAAVKQLKKTVPTDLASSCTPKRRRLDVTMKVDSSSREPKIMRAATSGLTSALKTP